MSATTRKSYYQGASPASEADDLLAQLEVKAEASRAAHAVLENEQAESRVLSAPSEDTDSFSGLEKREERVLSGKRPPVFSDF